MPPALPCKADGAAPPPNSALTQLAYTRLSCRGAIRTEADARALARRLETAGGRRAPIGFGDPPRAEAKGATVLLAPVFIAGGVLAALLIALLRSL